MSQEAITPPIESTPWPADKVERRPVAELIEDAENARTHTEEQIAKIAASIDEFGWTMPILLDENGKIIAGHGRVRAARLLRLVEVPTSIAVGWSEAKRKAYALWDNKSALLADWDTELLASAIHAINEADYPIVYTGFSDDELSAFLAPLDDDGGASPPEDFASYDENIETEHQCPKCGYVWSGGKSL